MSINVRAHGLPSFPTIRIVDISPFHRPIRSARPTTPSIRRDRQRQDEASALLLFGAVAAARGAANGF